MIRETINIGRHSFICDLYDKTELTDVSRHKFVMLRPVVFSNDSIDVPEIFLLEKSIITNEVDLNTLYPVLGSSEQYTEELTNFLETNFQLYEFYNDDLSEKVFDCDIMKIYHPISKTKDNKTIVHLFAFINNVKIHFYCKPYLEAKTKSDNEFTENIEMYSEYIEIPIPDFRDLLSKNTYYKEDIIPLLEDVYYKKTSNNIIYNTTYTWLLDYTNIKTIKNNQELTVRKYIYKEIPDTIFNFPLNVLLFPYSGVENDLYLPDSDLLPNVDSFIYINNITLSSTLGFNDLGKLVIKTHFNYPHKEKFQSIREAYEYYKGVKFSEYTDIEYDEFDDNMDVDINGNTLTKQYQCAYMIQMASDVGFKNIIYNTETFVEGVTLFDDVADRNFEIPIFTKWEQMPEVLICRIIFIDRYLGIVTQSNFTVITKEYYKYLVRYNTDEQIYSIDLQSMQDKFVENVKCVIKKSSNNNTITLQQNTPKIIYKPVFYKVQDLQNIQVRANVTQNIGVNLINYLGKVETFNLTIDGQKFVESARNDAYVIFKIQANKLSSTGGTYHITNQDDEYISSGQWSLI